MNSSQKMYLLIYVFIYGLIRMISVLSNVPIAVNSVGNNLFGKNYYFEVFINSNKMF